tara:strand:- start:912 stop:1283 length:372 start_codon:yes stop_codon:yes gene_type:complete
MIKRLLTYIALVAVAFMFVLPDANFVGSIVLAGFVVMPIYIPYSIWAGGREIDKWGENFLTGRTRADYLESNPDSFSNGKFKSCHQCGEKSVYLKQLGNTKHGIHQGHICRGCGTELWRSNLS